MTGGVSAMRSTNPEDVGIWNSVGTDLNVTVAVLYRSASADAADGANDHPSTFCWPSWPSKEAKLSRTWDSVTWLEMLEILKASPVAPAAALPVATILSRFGWSSPSLVLRLDIVLYYQNNEGEVLNSSWKKEKRFVLASALKAEAILLPAVM